MRNPEYKDKLTEYSAADRAIMRASMNASRLANKKGTAKKAVAKRAVAKKAAAPKPTDSRFSGIKKPDPKKPTDSRFSGIKKTAPKPKDSRFSGIKANQSPVMPGKGPVARVSPAPTRPRFGGFSIAAAAISKAAANTPKAKRDARNAAAAKKSK